MTGKELEERNYYVKFYNDNESSIAESLKRERLQIRNMYTVAKKENFKLETFFHSHGKKYYTENTLGPLLIEYIQLQLISASEHLFHVVTFENRIWLFDLIRLPIKNPYIEKYNQELDQMESLAMDQTLAKRLGMVLTEERYKTEMPFVVEELLELGYPELSETILVDTYHAIKARKPEEDPDIKIKRLSSVLKK